MTILPVSDETGEIGPVLKQVIGFTGIFQIGLFEIGKIAMTYFTCFDRNDRYITDCQSESNCLQSENIYDDDNDR